MSLTAFAIVLIILVAAICGLQVFVHPYIKKFTNYYVFWLVISILGLIYFVFGRWMWDCMGAQRYLSTGEILPYYSDPGIDVGPWDDFFKSKSMLTDLCPFFFLGMCISLICDRSRKIASFFCGPAIIGTIFTYAGMVFNADNLVAINAEFIFLGRPPYRMMFILHFLNLVIAVGIWLNTPSLKWKTFLWTNVTTFSFYLYVIIMAYSFDINHFVSGMKPGDWAEGGDYYVIGIIFKGIPFPYIIFIPLLISYGVVSSFICFHYLMQSKTKRYHIPNKKAKNTNVFLGYYDLKNKA